MSHFYFHFCQKKWNLGRILFIFIHSLINSLSNNKLPQSLGCMWWNLDSGFQRTALSCMPDSKAQDFGLDKQNFPVSWILQGKISLIPNSRFPYKRRHVLSGWTILFLRGEGGGHILSCLHFFFRLWAMQEFFLAPFACARIFFHRFSVFIFIKVSLKMSIS